MMREITPKKSDLEPIEIASRDEIAALQLRRLRRTVAHAYQNSPFYRRHFDAHDVHPDDLKHLDDLAKFPYTTKQHLRDNYPFGMFACARDEVARLHASSGTTGKPTVVGYSAADVENWAALVARSIRASGGRAGDVVHVAYGYGLFTGGLGAHYGAEKLGCTVVPVSGGQTARQVMLINDFRPDIIMVTPSYMLVILDALLDAGMEPAATSLAIGIFGAEPWSDAMRGEIEAAFDLHAVDIYGLSEVMGPGVACECVETKDGLHIWEDHFYPEIIASKSGDVLPDGELGELVFSTIKKHAMPLIRYRTGDLTRLLPGTARSMRRMEKISGRADDMIILRGVNVFPTQIEAQICAVPGLAAHYQIELTRNRRLDKMTVLAEAATDTDAPTRDELGREAARRIKEVVGVNATVVVREPGGVERSQGKARRVVDNRPAAD